VLDSSATAEKLPASTTRTKVLMACSLSIRAQYIPDWTK
jgi:hypothetical protein